MKISFYGPINTGAIIRQADAQVYNMLTGLTDSDELLETIRVIPNPSDASPDSDYVFTTLVYEALDSA